jgi:hypothetical protein
MLKDITDKNIEIKINEKTDITNTTKQNLIYSMKRILSIILYNEGNLNNLNKKNLEVKITNKKNIYKFITNNVDVSIEKLKVVYVNNFSTLISTVSFILSVIKYFDLQTTINVRLRNIVQKWLDYHTELKEIRDESRMTGVIEEGKISINWLDVLSAQRELEKEDNSSIETLLLSLYTLISPGRIKEYFSMKINPTNIEEKCNMLVLKEENSYMKIVDYKNNKYYGDIIKQLPTKLEKIIRLNIQKNPRKYLLTTSKNENFKTSNALGQYISKIFEKIFKKKITINTLRHSYSTYQISLYKENRITLKELNESAISMQHTLYEHLLYEQRPFI